MSIIDVVRQILGLRPVKVGDLAAEVAPPPPMQQTARNGTTSISLSEDISDIEVVPEYTQTKALVEANASLIFITGGAGTGKTVLIRYLRNVLRCPMAIVAPTGVAALNAGGVTIHSLFHLPPKVIQPEDVKRVYDRRLYNKLELLIIDEVSMVRPDVLDGVDKFLRMNRGSGDPFGGVQVLLIGDLFQLPPVTPRDEQLALRNMGYSTDFFFGSKGIAECQLAPILLRRVFRQRDRDFIALLDDLRKGQNVSEALRIINARCVSSATAQDGGVVLTCTNRAADARNMQELSNLPSRSRTYVGRITGEFRIGKHKLPAPMDLTLKAGAQVMFTKNDSNRRWVNGTLGRVAQIEARTVWVQVTEGGVSGTFEVAPVTWDKYRYEYDPSEDRIIARVVGRYTQLPLMLAWAVTIHKAQGKTLSKVIVDLGQRAFAPGQVYVALSRARSLDDIRLARPIRETEVRSDENVVRFYRQLLRMTRLTESES